MVALLTSDIASTLGTYAAMQNVNIEVFVEFPSDQIQTSEGLYVARFFSGQRNGQKVTLQNSGSIYEIVDQLELYLIQGQLNPTTDQVLNLIDDYVDDTMFVNAGYFRREYSVEQLYRKNNECYRVILSLTRIKTIN